LWVGQQRSNKNKLTAVKRAALESIPGWVWTAEGRNEFSWDEQLAALREYVVAHNELPKTSHEHLGVWIKKQRSNKSLSAKKKAALEAIPGWAWKTREVKNKYSWEEQLAALREYVAAHDELPKSSHERLGNWITTQRKNKSIAAERKTVLEAIPGWVWKSHKVKNRFSWEEQLAALREHVRTHGRFPKRRHERLGLWVYTQRKNKNALTAEKQAALEAIPGWVWTKHFFINKYTWEEQLAALREYAVVHNALPRQVHRRLGAWMGTQRQNYKKHKLSVERVNALQSVPLWKW
jgi:uncharacterized membrane protein